MRKLGRPADKQEQLRRYKSKQKSGNTNFYETNKFGRMNMFKWSEAARLQVIQGVKAMHMENNLSKSGQIKSWIEVAQMLPKRLFQDMELDQLANIAKKQFSEMRRKYHILKGNLPPGSMCLSKLKNMTRQILLEFDEYEEGCRLRGHPPYNPRPRACKTLMPAEFTRGQHTLETIPMLQPSAAKSTRGYDNALVKLLTSYSANEIENVPPRFDSSSESDRVDPVDDDQRYNLYNAAQIEFENSDDDKGEHGPEGMEVDRPDRSSASAADSDSDEISKYSESYCRGSEVLERTAHCDRRQLRSAERAEQYFTIVERKEDSFSDIDRLQRELESAVAAAPDNTSEENYKNRSRQTASLESPLCQFRGRKSEDTLPAANHDTDSEPSGNPEIHNERDRKEIGQSLHRHGQRGSSAACSGDRSFQQHQKEINFDILWSPRLPFDRQRRVVSSESDSEPSDPRIPHHDRLPPARESPSEDGHRRSPKGKPQSADSDPESENPKISIQRRHQENGDRWYRSSADGDSDEEDLQAGRHLKDAACSDWEDLENREMIEHACKDDTACNDWENHENHEKIEPACKDSDSEENYKGIADDATEEYVKAVDEFDTLEESELHSYGQIELVPRSPAFVDVVRYSQSNNPKNGSSKRDIDDEGSSRQQSRPAESAEHDSEGNSQAAASQECNNEPKDPGTSTPVDPVDIDSEDDDPALNINGKSNNYDLSQAGESLHGKSGSSADSESDDEGRRSSRRTPGTSRKNHYQARALHRTSVHRYSSRKRARRSGKFTNHEQGRIPTSKPRTKSPSSDRPEPEHDHHTNGSPVQQYLHKKLKRLDVEFSKFNSWTKHRLVPTARERIIQVITSPDIPKFLKKRGSEEITAAEYNELIVKCRQKHMGLVLKAEFQQIRAKLAEEMQKTTQVVVLEILESFKNSNLTSNTSDHVRSNA